jgi:hypothetical protein
MYDDPESGEEVMFSSAPKYASCKQLYLLKDITAIAASYL